MDEWGNSILSILAGGHQRRTGTEGILLTLTPKSAYPVNFDNLGPEIGKNHSTHGHGSKTCHLNHTESSQWLPEDNKKLEARGPFQKHLQTLQCKSSSVCTVWARYFLWNFKGPFWNSTSLLIAPSIPRQLSCKLANASPMSGWQCQHWDNVWPTYIAACLDWCNNLFRACTDPLQIWPSCCF